MDRIYCTLAELYEDLKLPGIKSESALMRHVKAASQFIEQTLGEFIPTQATRYYGPPPGVGAGGETELAVHALLSVTSVTADGTALVEGTDFYLEPDGRHWPNGPYSHLKRANEAIWSTSERGNVVAGLWGLYLSTLDLDALATTADASSTGLSVPDGSKVSPGMVLLIESEQMLVEATGTATTSTATLGADCTADASEITVSSGALVKAGEVIKIGFEHMRVEDIQSNTVQVQRGYNGSTWAAHLTGAVVYVHRAFTVKRGVNGTTAAAHTNAAVYRYEPPGDVNYLCRQIASLMIKKAETGYVGRSGNDDLGTGFWVNEFPRNQIEAVKSNYFWGGR